MKKTAFIVVVLFLFTLVGCTKKGETEVEVASGKTQQVAKSVERKCDAKFVPTGFSKFATIEMPLNMCFSRVIILFESPQLNIEDLTISSGTFPTSCGPVCPEGRTKESLGNVAGRIKMSDYDVGGKGACLKDIGFVEASEIRACYELSLDAPGKKPKDGQSFTCHVWTDYDCDGELEHYTKSAKYKSSDGKFLWGKITKDPASDSVEFARY